MERKAKTLDIAYALFSILGVMKPKWKENGVSNSKMHERSSTKTMMANVWPYIVFVDDLSALAL